MQASDLKLFRAQGNNDTNSNGGRETSVEIISGVLNNLFPSVTSEEREAGGSRLRKCFFHNMNASNEPGQAARAFIKTPSNGEDFFVLMAGDHLDVQGDLTGSEKQHCTGVLAQSASAGATQVVVDFDDVSQVDLADGDELWLYGSNGQMFNTVSGAVSWNGNRATINLADQLNVDYPAESVCAMVLGCGTLEPSFDSWAESSSQGTYDEAQHPPELDNQGTVRDDWTITFTSATEFTCSGLYEGNVGSGSTSQDFSPLNPATGRPLFTLRAAGWAGTWQAGDTVTFKTYPASKGIWVKEIWPAGASSEADNQVVLRLYAE